MPVLSSARLKILRRLKPSHFHSVAQNTFDESHIKSWTHFTAVHLHPLQDTFKMENSFIPQAIEIVTRAIEADNAGEYEKALSLYRDALGRFTMGLKYEKNEAKKKLVFERVEGYMKRAEELRDYVSKQNELDKNGGGGSATKKGGDKEDDADAEKKKLRGALAGAIVSEKPNISWDDVAGLDNAKESLKEVSFVDSFLYALT